MKLTPQLSLAFNGQCEEAFKFYAQCLNGTVEYMMTHGDAPIATGAPPGWEAKIFHATLKIGETRIAGGDVHPAQYEPPKGFSIILQMDDPAAAERIFQQLGAGGRVGMELQETFWAARFAVLIDRFGIPWTINCEQAGEPAH